MKLKTDRLSILQFQLSQFASDGKEGGNPCTMRETATQLYISYSPKEIGLHPDPLMGAEMQGSVANFINWNIIAPPNQADKALGVM